MPMMRGALVTRTLVLSNIGLFLFAMFYPAFKSGFDAENTSAMDLAHLRQDITAVLEECYLRGMRLPYLFVAVSLDGKLIGVRFTEQKRAMVWTLSLSLATPMRLLPCPCPSTS
jgi:hypothetical protein